MRENLRAARKDKDMSQEAIAELLDISARQYQRSDILPRLIEAGASSCKSRQSVLVR